MKFTLFNVVRIIVAIFIIGWWLLIARNYNESSDMKIETWAMWQENLLLSAAIVFIAIVILKFLKIKVF